MPADQPGPGVFSDDNHSGAGGDFGETAPSSASEPAANPRDRLKTPQDPGANPTTRKLDIYCDFIKSVALRKTVDQILKDGGEALVLNGNEHQSQDSVPIDDWSDAVTEIKKKRNLKIIVLAGHANYSTLLFGDASNKGSRASVREANLKSNVSNPKARKLTDKNAAYIAGELKSLVGGGFLAKDAIIILVGCNTGNGKLQPDMGALLAGSGLDVYGAAGFTSISGFTKSTIEDYDFGTKKMRKLAAEWTGNPKEIVTETEERYASSDNLWRHYSVNARNKGEKGYKYHMISPFILPFGW